MDWGSPAEQSREVRDLGDLIAGEEPQGAYDEGPWGAGGRSSVTADVAVPQWSPGSVSPPTVRGIRDHLRVMADQ